MRCRPWAPLIGLLTVFLSPAVSHNPQMGTLLDQSATMPNGAELLALEAGARRRGSGIVREAMAGRWRLQRIWPRGSSTPSRLASALLRWLGARLEIGCDADQLTLCNAVSLGLLSLEFVGMAELCGTRPLLRFSFDELRLCWGERRLWGRSLPPIEARHWPFFALIARDASGWLAARGRGGGLALWQLDS